MSKLIAVVFFVILLICGGLLFNAENKSEALALELTELKENVAELQHQAQKNSDQAELTNLQAIYGYYVDKAQWKDAADLFARDATLEIAGRGLFVGQDSIRTFLLSRRELSYGTLYNHMQLQPVIHVAEDGLSAKARWRSLMQVGQLGAEARWGEATYNNDYVKEDGIWKINKLHSFITFYVDYDKGWNKGAVTMPTQADDSAPRPDGDSTIRYGSFPEVFVPPYHYPNPVTGEDSPFSLQ